ncbi:MAG: tetratricopeptide repeat protein [Crocinitomicaceae bacterium]
MKILFLITLMWTLSLWGQDPAQQSQIDSLNKEISKAKHDTTKISLELLKADIFLKINTDSTIKIYNQIDLECENNLKKKVNPKEKRTFLQLKFFALHNSARLDRMLGQFDIAKEKLATCITNFEKIEEYYGLGMSFQSLGNIQSNLGENKESLESQIKSLNAFEKTDRKQEQLNALHNISNAYQTLGEPEKAKEYLDKCLVKAKDLNDEANLAYFLLSYGVLDQNLGNTDKAIINYTECLKYSEKLGEDQISGYALGNIAIIYTDLKEYDKSIEYQLRSLKVREKIGDNIGLIYSYINLGANYSEKGNNELALDYYYKAEKLAKEAQHAALLGEAYTHMGAIYLELGKDKLSLEFSMKALELLDKADMKFSLCTVLSNIGVAYQKQNQNAKAITYFKRSLDEAQQAEYLAQIIPPAKGLFEIYKKQREFKISLEYFELYITSKDSLEKEENQKEVIRQEYKYEYEKQALQDSIKNAEAQKIKDAELAAEKAEGKRLEIQNKQQQQQKYFLFGGLALALVFGGFIFNRFRVTRKQKGIIEEQKEKVDEAYEELGEKNQEILDSINYAKRIQSAILPPQKLVKSYLEQSFILYKPKDIVAGDFYWMEVLSKSKSKSKNKSKSKSKSKSSEQEEEIILFAAADCTGHGVPGAMVSVVCNNGLNRAVREYGLTDPGKILDKTREIVIQEFEKSEEEVKAGMDIAVVSLEQQQQQEQEGGDTLAQFSCSKLKYSGAHNPLWIIRNGAEEVEEIKADKQPIGKFSNPVPFTTHEISLNSGDTIYIFSDGFADQFGGEKGKKFKAANFKNLLLSVQKENMDKQRELIDQAFEEWKGNLEQLDDVCVIGVRV